MNTRSLLIAGLLAVSATFAVAQNVPMNAALTAQVQTAATAGDGNALQNLANQNPNSAAQVATVALQTAQSIAASNPAAAARVAQAATAIVSSPAVINAVPAVAAQVAATASQIAAQPNVTAAAPSVAAQVAATASAIVSNPSVAAAAPGATASVSANVATIVASPAVTGNANASAIVANISPTTGGATIITPTPMSNIANINPDVAVSASVSAN